jgi:phytoene dehydrogenase-like protein
MYDTIVIGSGAGGLACALSLAKKGQKVLVLEQHYLAGGWCHSFTKHGSRFSPGIHYIGLLAEGESSNNLYRGLGIANDLVFFRMNPKGYEHCRIGDERFDIPQGLEAFKEALIEKFPQEEKGITRYLNTVRDVSKELQLIPKINGFWDKVTIAWRTRHLGKYGLFSLKRVIGWHVKDPLLQTILNTQCGDHGLPPAKASFPLHSAVMEHYLSGAYYPMNGGASIVNAMVKSIEKNAGEVRLGQKVKNIIIQTENNTKSAVGVELTSGKKIYASRVVSNADPKMTYETLVGREYLSEALSKKLSESKYSCTSLMLFLTVDMDVKSAGIDSGNIWIMPNRDMDDVYDEMMSEDIMSGDEFSGIFISCTTLKDPASYDGEHHTFEVLTFINYDAFRKFEHEEKKRSLEYLSFKEKLTQKMVNSLEKAIPGISEHIVHKDLGTPITNAYYINATEGSVYGTQKTLNQIGPNAFRAQSEIENLYLCGASILAHGVTGATYSGVDTAARILGCRQEDLIVPSKEQHLRIYDAEDDSEYPLWLKDKIKEGRKYV